MPIGDSELSLRDLAALAAVETGAGVDVGPAPLGSEMMARINFATLETSVTLKLSECATSDGTYADIEEGPWTFTAAGTYLRRIYWGEKYLLAEVTAMTGTVNSLGVTIISGGKPS